MPEIAKPDFEGQDLFEIKLSPLQMASPQRPKAYILPPGTSSGYFHGTSTGFFNWVRVPPEISRLSLSPALNDVNPPGYGTKEISTQTGLSLEHIGIQTDLQNEQTG